LGTVTPILDAAHMVSGATGGSGGAPTVSASDPENPIRPGTRLGFAEEHVVGFEQQLPHNFVVSVRYINRRLRRIVEDAASVSPEAALAGVGQVYYIGNISSTLDAAVNLVPFQYKPGGPIPAGCAKDSKGNPSFAYEEATRAVCFAQTGIDADGNAINVPDGKPDGFPDPIHRYWAVEFEVNKRFSNNWQLLSNYRYASLRGNYEGHLRNDNGQTDPAISSLFDFTTGDFGLLGDQFANGPLNSDRHHIVNIFGSYAMGEKYLRFAKGLNVGAGFHFETGLPISEYLAHPVYLNAGEIPVGGRGKLGRSSNFAKLDLHADYPWVIKEHMKVTFNADFFNVTNNQPVRIVDQFRESTAGQNNPDFLKPQVFAGATQVGYYLPFSMRLGVKFEF
jgi:hypothetical protein